MSSKTSFVISSLSRNLSFENTDPSTSFRPVGLNYAQDDNYIYSILKICTLSCLSIRKKCSRGLALNRASCPVVNLLYFWDALI